MLDTLITALLPGANADARIGDATLERRLARLVAEDVDFVGLADAGFRFVHLNPAGRRRIGATDRDLDHLRLTDPVVARERTRVEHEAIPRLAAGDSWRGRVTLRHLVTGAERPHDLTLFPLADGGFAAIARAATGDDGARTERFGKRFLAGVSHWLRTPLGTIVGFADLARQPGTSARELGEYLDVIERSAAELMRLADDLADFTHLAAGSFELRPRELVLEEFLTDFGWLLALRAREKDVRFQLATVGRLPRTIVTDPMRLGQILRGLAGHAIQSTERGFVRLNVSAREHELTFVITDTGRGLTPEACAKIFVPFESFDPASAPAGLDLALARELCRRMGGDLRVEASVPGVETSYRAHVRFAPATRLHLVRG